MALSHNFRCAATVMAVSSTLGFSDFWYSSGTDSTGFGVATAVLLVITFRGFSGSFASGVTALFETAFFATGGGGGAFTFDGGGGGGGGAGALKFGGGGGGGGPAVFDLILLVRLGGGALCC